MICKDLGLFLPSHYSKSAIRSELLRFVVPSGEFRVAVRGPQWHSDPLSWEPATYHSFVDIDVRKWHRDYPGHTSGYNDYNHWTMTIWATSNPTEVRYCNSQRRIELEPYHVYTLSNTFLHRTPAMTDADRRKRWWARILQNGEL